MQIESTIIDRKNLSPTEAKVLAQICSAQPSKGIARNLDMSIKRVDKHIDNVYEKLGIRWLSLNKRAAAIVIAVQTGIISTVLRSVVLVLIVQFTQFNNDKLTRPRFRKPVTSAARIRMADA